MKSLLHPLTITLLAGPLALLASTLACTPASTEDHREDSPEAASAASSNAIDIPATVRSNLGITFAPVELRRVAQTIRVPGAFELQPLARREYRMALPGRVEMLVTQFERIEPGQPLFRFQSPAWPELLHEIIIGEQAIDTALAEIEVGKARLVEAERKHELARSRLESLADAEFRMAELEVQAVELEASLPRLKAELRLAEIRRVNAERTRQHALHRAATASGIPEERLKSEIEVDGERVPIYQTIDWIDVRAVVGGIVEQMAVSDGAFVEPPAAVLSTVDTEKVRFRALALQGDLPKVLGAERVRIVPPRSPGISIEEAIGATMTIGLEAHPQERTMTLIAVPDELEEWVRPGISAFLEVEVRSSEAPALAVPRSAIVQDGLTHVFFRRDPANPNRAIRVEADMGISDGRWVVLRSGVMRGDEVVLAGVYELKLAMDQGGVMDPGGHVHADGTSHSDH